MNKIIALGLCLTIGSSCFADRMLQEVVAPPACASHSYLGAFRALRNTVILFVLANAAVRAEPTNQSNGPVRPLGFVEQIAAQRKNPGALHALLMAFGAKNHLPVRAADDNDALVQKMLLAPAPAATKVTLVYGGRFFHVSESTMALLLNDRNWQVRLAATNTIQAERDPRFSGLVQNRLRTETYHLVLCSLAACAIDLQGPTFVDRTILDSIGEKPVMLKKQHAAEVLMLLQETKYDEMVIAELLRLQNKSPLIAKQLEQMDQDKVNRVKRAQGGSQWIWLLVPFSLPFAYGVKRFRQSSLKEAV